MIYSAHVTMDEAFARYEAVRGRFPSAVARQAGPPCDRPIADLSLITGAFDIFVFDAFGVLNVGERPIDGARARIDALRAAGKHLFVLTNAASYNRDEAREKFLRLGFDFTDEEIISSRAVCEQHLKAFQADLTWGIIAQDGFDPSDLGVRSVLLGDDAALYDRADAFLFLSSAAWGDERQALLRSSLSRAARPIVVANPDLVAPREVGLSLEPGWYVHDLIDTLPGLEIHFHGKPFASVYAALESRLGCEANPSRIVMMGDSLHTDILGAMRRGWGSVLITDHGFFKGRDIAPFLEQSGLYPDFIAPHI